MKKVLSITLSLIMIFSLVGSSYVFALDSPEITQEQSLENSTDSTEVTEDISSDNGEGKLIATPTITNNDSEFTNTKLYSIEVDKTVAGNMGDKNKNFTFTLLFNEEVSDISYEKHVEEEVLTGDVELTNNAYEFTLKDSEKIIFNHIPHNTVYTIAENDYREEGYEIRVDGNVGREVENTLTENKVHKYINSKTGPIPTKVKIRYGMLMLLLLLISSLLIRKNQKFFKK